MFNLEEFELTDEQQRVVDHPPYLHARVLAGPGTGKSFTATVLLGQLVEDESVARVKMLTFTRAATAEFAGKLADAGLEGAAEEPSTVHSHALSVLMGLDGHELPSPIRIPDSWETKQLIRRHLSRLLKARGFAKATPGCVKDLEGEMAASWETLIPDLILIGDLDPDLRAAYVAQWGEQRQRFGYALLAELPYQAAMALEDLGEDRPPRVDFLIVDEYQDLNPAGIRLIKAHVDLGIPVVAIGDDDQSIYRWRHADPSGIRRFHEEFPAAADYTLSISHRCGKQILAAAAELIATAPDRAQKPTLIHRDGAQEGVFAHLRFATGAKEAEGVAAICARRCRDGVDPSDILLLVRTSAKAWVRHLDKAFANEGLSLAHVEWVDDAVGDPMLRAGIALGRLLEDKSDCLAWWGLTEGLTHGLGPKFTEYVYERCAGRRWGETLLGLYAAEFPDLGQAAAVRANNTILAVLRRLEEFESDPPTLGIDENWATWLRDELETSEWPAAIGLESGLTDEASRLVELVGPQVDPDVGLVGTLNQLEPLGKDLARTESGGIRLMTMGGSKGLTVDTAIVLGVEEGIVPFHRTGDRNEERRLLYVAMTRAKEMCVLTSASRRYGPLARTGTGTVQSQRARSSLLRHLTFGNPQDGEAFVQHL